MESQHLNQEHQNAFARRPISQRNTTTGRATSSPCASIKRETAPETSINGDSKKMPLPRARGSAMDTLSSLTPVKRRLRSSFLDMPASTDKFRPTSANFTRERALQRRPKAPHGAPRISISISCSPRVTRTFFNALFGTQTRTCRLSNHAHQCSSPHSSVAPGKR